MTRIPTIAAFGLVLLAGTAQAAEDHVRLKFAGCTAQQEEQITKAVSMAAEAVDQVIDQLSRAKLSVPADAAVDRWFGERTGPHTIAGQLQHVADRLDIDANLIVAQCDSTVRDVFAWTPGVTPGHGFMGFGQPFFQAPLVGGFDSAMGTIVHELTHMVPGIAADDHAYAIRQMEAFARDDPKTAFDNAQSYEYLVEELYDACFNYGNSCELESIEIAANFLGSAVGQAAEA